MNNSFLEILKQALCKNVVYITYKKKEDVFYSKFFIKEKDEKFYDNETHCFNLTSHVDNKLEIINECDIIKFQFSDESDSNDIKNDFILLSEKIKEDYQKLLPFKHIVSDFDAYFFNETVKLNNFKLVCLLELSSLEDFENNNENVLPDIKKLWKRKIEEHKTQILKYLDSEIDLKNSVYDEETIKEIKDLIYNFNADNDLKSISYKEELFEYWPSILLPAPDFINEVYNLYANSNR